MTILLRGVRLYGEGDEVDIKIDDGQIAAIGAGLEVPGDAEIIDVRGQVATNSRAKIRVMRQPPLRVSFVASPADRVFLDARHRR